MLLALVLLAASTLACATDPARPLNQYFRETWTTRQGLPHNLVLSVAQTPDGYLWFGTWEGVVRYNGREFHVFDRGSVAELGDNGVRSLQVLRNGSLWLGTSRGGTALYADGRWSTLRKRDGLAEDEIMDLAEDGLGRRWVATESSGLDRIDGTSIRHFRRRDGLPSDALYTVAVQSDGVVWAGTTEGLARIEDDTVRAYGPADGLPRGPVFSALVAPDGGVYVGTEKGPYVLHGGRFQRVSEALPEDLVPHMLVDRAGALWVGTVNYGLLRLHAGKVDNLGSQVGLPNNRVSSLFEDREGSLWVGTNGGLMRLRDAPFATYTVEHGLPDDYVRTVLGMPDGDLWIGTSRGLSRLRGNHFDVWTRAEGLPGDSILSLAPARAGGVWVGTYSNGLIRFDDGAVRESLTSANGIAGNQVRAISEDRDGVLWIGTSRGLSALKNGKVRNYTLADGLPRDYVIALHASVDGRMWVGTANGAAVIDGSGVHALDMSGLGEPQDIFGFHEDADATLWMATDRGLIRLRDGQLRGVGRAQGMPVDAVFQVVEDGAKNFWLSSNRGVLRLARKDAEAVADGRQGRVTVQVYGEADGMGSAQCNGGSDPAAWVGTDGRVWVATAKGLASIDPQHLERLGRAPPPLTIEEIRIDDRVLPMKSELVLPAGTRKVEFRFVGLSFVMPERIRYRYRLEGFDDDWIDVGTQRFAQFTNLAHGDYRFRLSAANPDGAWNADEATVLLHVESYPWQRPAFWVAAGLLGLLLLYSGFRWRLHQLRADERRLREVVDQRTADLREQAARLTAADLEKTELLARLREQAEAAERQARHDALTELANRRHFDERLAAEFARALREGRPLSIALFDIDHFKRINDNYSHAAGDAALRLVAQLLRDGTRPGDLVARYGGEEFVVLFAGTTLDEARVLAEALRVAVETADCSAVAPDLHMTVSAGIADLHGAYRYERMISRADANLYEAKRAGRNCVRG